MGGCGFCLGEHCQSGFLITANCRVDTLWIWSDRSQTISCCSALYRHVPRGTAMDVFSEGIQLGKHTLPFPAGDWTSEEQTALPQPHSVVLGDVNTGFY